MSLVLGEHLKPHLSTSCHHLKGNGGIWKAIRQVRDHLPQHKFVCRSDIKGYYASINHFVLMDQLRVLIPDKKVMRLLGEMLRRTVKLGEYYWEVRQGISLGNPLSPLLGALYLKPLDEAMARLPVQSVAEEETKNATLPVNTVRIPHNLLAGTTGVIYHRCQVAPTQYTSGDEDLLEIVNNRLTAKGAGNVTVTAVGGSCDGQETQIRIGEEDTLAIASCEELQNTQYQETTRYVLSQDIDCSASKEWEEGNGFRPLTPNGAIQFYGNGFIIKNLTINRPDQNYVGLFGWASGDFFDIALEGGDILGNEEVGGLVGYLYGSSTISNSYATGNVSGNEEVGGLVGSLHGSSEVSHSYATGNVSGENEEVGGLVGYLSNSSRVSNSYATGNISGNEAVGGLVGRVYSSAEVSHSYAIGHVSGNEEVGGLVGKVYASSTVSNSYWSSELAGLALSQGGTDVSVAALKQQSTYENWNFTDTWVIDPDYHEGFPVLKASNDFDNGYDSKEVKS